MNPMRLVSRPRTILPIAAGVFTLLLLTPTVYAASYDESAPSPELLAQLEQRASEANPREQCFLYTEVVHVMIEKAGKEIADGDTQQASATLKLVNEYAHLIQTSIVKDTKRLKNAEELMQHTTFRLGEYLHLVSPDDKPTVQATLTQLDQVNDQMLNQVFAH